MNYHHTTGQEVGVKGPDWPEKFLMAGVVEVVVVVTLRLTDLERLVHLVCRMELVAGTMYSGCPLVSQLAKR